MFFRDLLTAATIDPSKVVALRHSPAERDLRRALPWLAVERPELFNAYQQTQNPRVERDIAKSAYVASFIGHVPRQALFVGLYSVGGSQPLTKEQFWRAAAYIELAKLGMVGFKADDPRETLLLFDLNLRPELAQWKGRLIVSWPPPEIRWWRSGDADLGVHAIAEENRLTPSMPDWRDLDVSWDQLAVLPSSWRAALAQWRGVYLIFDTSDAKSYVGSAYGGKNMLGRWEGYGDTGHGGNALLRQREPRHFRFSILERVSPDMPADEVIRLESSWKERLHTRQPFGLNIN